MLPGPSWVDNSCLSALQKEAGKDPANQGEGPSLLKGQQLSLWSTGSRAATRRSANGEGLPGRGGYRSIALWAAKLGRIAIPAAHLSWGQIGWEGSFQDYWPTVSTKSRKRPRWVPRALRSTNYLLALSCLSAVGGPSRATSGKWEQGGISLPM